MGLTAFPNGVSSFGIPVLGSGDLTTTGNVFFVDDSGSDSGDGTSTSPFATLDYAIGRCTANHGDIIILMPGHAESVSSTIAVDVAGIKIIGLGHGEQRPNLTQATTGSDNVMEVSAANVLIENIMFTGSTTGTSEVFIDVQAGADQLTIRNCVFEQNTKNLEAVTVQAGADYLTIEGCTFQGVAAGADSAIIFEDATDGTNTLNPVIRDCIFNYTGSSGCDNGVIVVSISSGGVTGILIRDCQFLGLADGEAAVDPQKTSSGRATGLMMRLHALTADGTDAFVQSDLLGAIECYTAQAGTKGLIRPATTQAA